MGEDENREHINCGGHKFYFSGVGEKSVIAAVLWKRNGLLKQN